MSHNDGSRRSDESRGGPRLEDGGSWSDADLGSGPEAGRIAIAAFLATTAIGLVESMAYVGYALAGGSGLEYGLVGVLIRILPRWWIWAALAPLIARSARLAGGGGRTGALALHLAEGVALAAVHILLWGVYRQAAGITDGPLLDDVSRLAVNFLVLNFVTFLAISGAFRVRELMGGARARERERARLAVRTSTLEARLAEARMRALAAQMRPHFLFNALNAISELVHEDPDEAERMIARLGDLLRLVLERTERHEVTLTEELEIVHAYLEIERRRFRGRLRIRVDVAEDALTARVPTLSVQPLVENAVRHGVNRSLGRGLVSLRAAVDGTSLQIEVCDDGPGPAGPFPEDAPADGVGLANTRSRLRQLYGDRACLRLEAPEGGGTRAILRIPTEAKATP